MSDEIVSMGEETGEFRGRKSVPADSMSAVMVILTAIFMLMSITLIVIELYTVYDVRF